MKSSLQNAIGFLAAIIIVAFFSTRIAPFSLAKTILATIATATILYYSAAQISAKRLPTKTKETLSRKIVMPMFAAFLVFFFFDLYLQKLNLFVSAIGTVLEIIASFFYAKSVLFLGGFYSGDVEIKRGHKLVKNGAFGIVRHPAYLCALVFYAGMALAANSLACAALVLFFFVPWTLYRIKLEEEFLSKEFGKGFLEYNKRVPALIPKLF